MTNLPKSLLLVMVYKSLEITMVYENPLPIITDFTNHANYILFSIAILLLCTSIIVSIYFEHASKSSWYKVEEDEYNFMASSESEQSRLDLAKAFLEIQHMNEAKVILNELLKSQNPLIREQSKELLKGA